MKKFIEICEEIKKEKRAATAHTANDEYDRIFDDLRDVLARFHAGTATEEEKATAREKERAALDAYKREEERNTAHKLRAEILKENAKQAFFAEYIGKICEIWNRYEGKPYGEKTADKIRAELNALTGQYISIYNKWGSLTITIATARDVPIDNFEIGARNGSDKISATDESNKILKIDPNALRVWYCSEYVTDINAHIKALKKAHENARKAYEKAQDAFSEYNKLTRGNIERADIHHGTIKKYLI
jgi:hypothetical protein